MLNEKQIERMIEKLARFESILSTKLFKKVCSLEMDAYQTQEQLYSMPKAQLMKPIKKGDTWGGSEHTYCWMKTTYTVPEDLEGVPLFVRPRVGGYEGLLFVDGAAKGNFATKIAAAGHGNHYCNMIEKNPKVHQVIEVGLEFYTGHYIKGNAPFEDTGMKDFNFAYDTVDICVENQEVADFYFDLKVINELYSVLDDQSYRKAELINVLKELHKILYYSIDNIDEATFLESLRRGREILAPALASPNGPSMPSVGIIGHSHMDTAWLWHIDETIKKCARTYANQLNLMERYPEYKFVQSSAYHSDMILKNYPELFERIKEKVAEGRYEPNGGVWVECDCNITSGESMIRQFLWGQRFTQKHFGYTSDSFWLPDTFGYSASIPQIMKGSGVTNFLTTKMGWNDTNAFPYDTFWWEGIDGTKVFTHFNMTHIWPSPKYVNPLCFDHTNRYHIKQKHVSNQKLVSYGLGDGGGGPQFEMIELARRCKDLEGAPKMEHTTVSEFMEKMVGEVKDPTTYSGELYLELHRGTLTSQHEIKRNNRIAEVNLHNLEYLTVQNAVNQDEVATDKEFREFQNTLLVNQFHDILPGTSIPRVHAESKQEMTEVIEKSNVLIHEMFEEIQGEIAVVNTTSFERNDVIYIPYKEGCRVSGGYKQQVVDTLKFGKQLAVAGVVIPSYSSVNLTLEQGEIVDEVVIAVEGNRVETKFASILFDDKMYMSSFVDKSINRELCGEGYPFNTFITGEDVPLAWDNWDIDADLQMKMKDNSALISSEVISNGAVEFRVRNKYQVAEKSFIEQDMIFYVDNPQVKFETMMDWNDDHRFMKTAFDTSVFSDFVRQEIQFGYIKRPTTRNNTLEQAKFEVLNHKYTDLSESQYGVAILNDCKYGISAHKGQLRLSLHKGGCNPDFTGDKGMHYCEYAFLPHNHGFDTDTVIKPAYLFNYKQVVLNTDKSFDSLVVADKNNIIIETIKPCEDKEKAFILRLYDAEGTYTNTTISIPFDAKSIEITNMLEEVIEPVSGTNKFELTFKPFEIKTIKICY